MPDLYNNTDVLRTFGSVGMRIIQHRGVRLAFLKNYLEDFDKKENRHCRSLTEYQKRLPGCPVAKGDEDILIDELE